MSRPLVLGLAALLGGGCEPTTPTPADIHVLEVTPGFQNVNAAQKVQVHLDADPAFLVDYGAASARMVSQPHLEIDSFSAPLTYLGHGLFETMVEPLVPGFYAVKVDLGDGRAATSEIPYEMRSVAKAKYDFASVGPQVQGQPFTLALTVHVEGRVPGEGPFQGSATLTIYTQSQPVFITQLGPFLEGTIYQPVTLDRSGDDFVAYVKDATGEFAFSNSFPVAPPTQ